MLSNLLDKVSPEVVAGLDPFPDTEPFTGLHAKQAQLCEEQGGAFLAEKIEQFLSRGSSKGLCPVRTEGLKFLHKSLRAAKFEIPLVLKQGNSHSSYLH